MIRNAAGEKFITFFVARYNHSTGILEYVNAAHNPPVVYNTDTGRIALLKAGSVGVGMLDEIPLIEKGEVVVDKYSKIICYTDGLSELKDDNGKDVGTDIIVKHISNLNNVSSNISNLIAELGIPDNNPGLFDDVSIIAADLRH